MEIVMVKNTTKHYIYTKYTKTWRDNLYLLTYLQVSVQKDRPKKQFCKVVSSGSTTLFSMA